MTFFKVLVLLLLCVVGIGFYRGWFTLSSNGGGDDNGKVEVNLTVDPDKAKQDAQAATTKARDLTRRSVEEAPSVPSEGDVKLKDGVRVEDGVKVEDGVITEDDS